MKVAYMFYVTFIHCMEEEFWRFPKLDTNINHFMGGSPLHLCNRMIRNSAAYLEF